MNDSPRFFWNYCVLIIHFFVRTEGYLEEKNFCKRIPVLAANKHYFRCFFSFLAILDFISGKLFQSEVIRYIYSLLSSRGVCSGKPLRDAGIQARGILELRATRDADYPVHLEQVSDST